MRKFFIIVLAICILSMCFVSCSSNAAGDINDVDSGADIGNGGSESYNTGNIQNDSSVESQVPSGPLYNIEEGKVTFGSYPQANVTDADLVELLNEKAGELPTSDEPQNWTSYEYCNYGNVSDYMWYIDVEEDGVKYRGVYFESYRAALRSDTSSTTSSNQDDNSYYIEKVYWFEYEPITWKVLAEEEGKVLILCESIIDSQEYGTYSNSYATSTIRNWLNEEFYNTAFTELQQEIILTTVVDNSVASTGYPANSYASENTEDKIFLLSRVEVKDSSYGFTSEYLRAKTVTDYAKSQGVYSDIASSGWWWLRSPLNNGNSNITHMIGTNGSMHSIDVAYVSGGVVPALWLSIVEE